MDLTPIKTEILKMVNPLYSIYDIKAQVFRRPFMETNDNTAKRAFQAACQQEGSELNIHAEDYTLVRIGDFNDATGTLQPQEPERIWSALEARGGGRDSGEPQANSLARIGTPE